MLAPREYPRGFCLLGVNMNDNERVLIRLVCEGDIRKAQSQAKIILDGISSQRDERFKETMLRKLEVRSPQMIELPYNLRELLIAEDVTDFPMSRFLLRESESRMVERLLKIYKASDVLQDKGIPYFATMILYGESGTGKTMLARYIAHKAGVPFVYMRFSSIVSSYLGSTQSNIAKVFDYARNAPCALCIDEIDAIGIKRGDRNDVSEMSRVVIALMQEMDRLPNNVIVIGTTNRFDRLDPALIRRFSLSQKVDLLSFEDTCALAKNFFTFAEIEVDGGVERWCSEIFCMEDVSAAKVVSACTEYVVQRVIDE